MLTQEQLKNYREQLSQHFAKGKEQIDSRGVIGALLTALGIERSRVIPDAVKRLRFEKADKAFRDSFGWHELTKERYRPKAFDIVNYRDLAEFPGTIEETFDGQGRVSRQRLKNNPISWVRDLIGGKRDGHSAMLIPDARGRLRMAVLPDGDMSLKAPGRSSANRAVNALMSSAPKKLSINELVNWPNRFRSNFTRLGRPAPAVGETAFQDWLESLPLASDMYSAGGSRRILRTATPLTSAEKEQLAANVRKVVNQRIRKPDVALGGIRNFLFGSGSFKGQAPSTCAGGICSAFKGVRDLGDPSRTIPIDFRANSNLKEVGNFYNRVLGNADQSQYIVGPTRAKISKQAISNARRALATRFGMAAAPLGLGGFMLGSSPTFQKMVNPLAEQGKIIGQKVQDYVNKARNNGS